MFVFVNTMDWLLSVLRPLVLRNGVAAGGAILFSLLGATLLMWLLQGLWTLLMRYGKVLLWCALAVFLFGLVLEPLTRDTDTLDGIIDLLLGWTGSGVGFLTERLHRSHVHACQHWRNVPRFLCPARVPNNTNHA